MLNASYVYKETNTLICTLWKSFKSSFNPMGLFKQMGLMVWRKAVYRKLLKLLCED